MSVSDSETGVAFEVSLEDSSPEALTKPPDLPRHLRIRMEAYASSRPKKNIDAKLQEAENRRRRQINRRLENARRAEERCRRIAEAMTLVTDYNRHLTGKEIDGQPPNPNEVRAIFENVKDDLNVVIGRVDREAVRMLDRKYVHNPISYKPKRRNTHTEKCTCECCYLENKEKLSTVQKDLMEVLYQPEHSYPSDDNDQEQFQMEMWDVRKSTPQKISKNVRFQERPPKSSDLGFSSHAILDIPLSCKSKIPNPEAESPGNSAGRTKSQGVNASIAVGPDCGVQTRDICCPSCDALQSLHNLTRSSQTKAETADTSSQTDPEMFTCHCCQVNL